MDLALRPMSTSQVLDRTFQIYRSHFLLLAGIGALLPALLLVLQLGFIPLGYPPRTDYRQPPETVAVVLLAFVCCYGLVYVLGQALTGGAVVFAVSKLHLGQSATIAQSYKQVFSRFWKILGVIVLISLIVFGTLIVGELIAILLFGITAGSFSAFSGGRGAGTAMIIFAAIWGITVFLAGAGAALYFYARLALAVPACVLEGLPVRAAFRRSWYLSKGSAGRIILAFFLTWVLGVVLSLVLGLPGQIYQTVMHKGLLLGIIMRQIGAFIAGVLANPISVTAIALIYYDQRVRKEAFDLQLMMEAVGQQPPQQMAATVPPSIG